jgi:hypothetical protein
MANGFSGLTAIDISNPAAPSALGFFATQGSSFEVAVAGGFAYVANGVGGLRVLDLSNRAVPREVGLFAAANVQAVAVEGSLAYVGDSGALTLVDVSNPAAPALVSRFLAPGTPDKVLIVGSLAYVAGFGGGVTILDIGNPALPSLIGTIAIPSAQDVVVVGNLAYVAATASGLHIVDVSVAAAPVALGSIGTFSFAGGLAVLGSFAYVADNSGLSIVNVTDPAAPFIVGRIALNANGVAVRGRFAYVASPFEGLKVIDVSDPANPTEIGFFDTPGFARRVTLAGPHLFVADQDAGVTILAHLGSLKVNIQPALATSLGARWKIAGGALKKSGQKITGLIPGKYSVRFKKAPGFTSPAGRLITIDPGEDKRIKAKYRR